MKRLTRQVKSGVQRGETSRLTDLAKIRGSWIELVICSLLLLVTIAAFWPVWRCDFVKYDDAEYVTENPQVAAGLAWRGCQWAFSTFHAGNWHPVTWLSHMLDCRLFGLNPGAHHLTNLFFHVASAILLFLAFKRMTGVWRQSAFVAALFALHPLHVESVAWVSERKDVLSTFFFMLTLLAYSRYTEIKTEHGKQKAESVSPTSSQPPSSIFYILALACFAFGLMSKSMLVTLPFVLLLLDYWPLKRFQLSTLWRLLLEKLPFFLLSIASSFITIRAQRSGGAVVPANLVPFTSRMGNALISYFRYLRKTVWPDDLAVFYPYTVTPPLWQVVAAGIFLTAISILAVVLIRRRPYLWIGWLWFLGTLVPVIGLVQVGGQSMADRYSYVPLIGIFIMLVWWTVDFTAVKPRWALVQWAVALVVLVGCFGMTRRQLHYWRNTEQLFTQALRVTKGNYIVHAIWGGVLYKQGRLDEAIAQYQASLQFHPANGEIHDSLGCALLEQGKLDEATWHMQQAVRINPNLASAHNDLGQALAQQGRREEAVTQFETAVQLDPELPDAHNNLANVLFAQKKYVDAEFHYRAALRLKPDFVPAHHNLGMVLSALGKTEEASAEFAAALRIEPGYAPTQFALAELLLKQGRKTEAIKWLAAMARNQPDNAEAHYRLGQLLAGDGQMGEAIQHLRQTVNLKPDWVPVLNELAWKLATYPDARFRDGQQAVDLASRAVQLTHTNDAVVLDTLAAGFAEAGRFDEAVKWAQQALNAAQAAGQKDLGSQVQEHLKLYQLHRPYRE